MDIIAIPKFTHRIILCLNLISNSLFHHVCHCLDFVTDPIGFVAEGNETVKDKTGWTGFETWRSDLVTIAYDKCLFKVTFHDLFSIIQFIELDVF